MKRFLVVLLFGLFLFPFKASADDKANVNINVLVGSRSLSHSGWKTLKVESQGLFGIDFDYGHENWPFSLLLGLSGSTATSHLTGYYYGYYVAGDIQVSTSEYDVGVRKYFNVTDTFKPYVSGGLGFIKLTQKVTCTSGCTGSVEDSDNAMGFFINGGLMWRFSGGFNFGLDIKVLSGASMKNNVNANYGQAALILGYGF